jgi:hypothetical protein
MGVTACQMQVVALVADAMAFTVGHCYEFVGVAREQIEDEIGAMRSARQQRLDEPLPSFRTVVDGIAVRHRIKAVLGLDVRRKSRRRGHKSLNGLEMREPVYDVHTIDVPIKLAQRNIDDRHLMAGPGCQAPERRSRDIAFVANPRPIGARFKLLP